MLTSALDRTLVEFSGIVITWEGIILALTVLVLSIVLSRVARRGLRRYAAATGHLQPGTIYSLARVLHYLLLITGLLVAISALGVPLNRFAIFTGALGIGLGFGLQTIFNNFISGWILLFDKSLRVGDFVELESGVHGEVRDIKVRSTTIVTNDSIDILVPNSEFVSGRVQSWTHGEKARRMRIPFGVAYGADKDIVAQAGIEAAAEVEWTLSTDGLRRPQVWLTGFGDSSLEFQLVVWLTRDAVFRPDAVRASYNWAIHSALQRHGIEIPFPQRDLNLRQLFGLEGDEALAMLRTGEPVTGSRQPSR